MSEPKLLCVTKGMSRERWLECRAHGPSDDIDYALGGSDVSVVFGENPWTTPLELYQVKKGLLKPDDSSNVNQKEMGHLMEPIVAHWYGKLTGNAVMEDYGLYQHADYPYALANLDYRVRESDGTKGILECKTTSWHKAGDWTDDTIPHYYELQIRFYMAVMDLEFADIACIWGTNPELDMAIRRVHRDRYIESMIFERLDEFIERLRTNTPPTMAGVAPELALKALAKVYGASRPELPTIEFGKKQEKALRRIAVLQEEKSDLDRKVRENEKEVTALSVKITEMMGAHEHGLLETPTDKLVVDYVTKLQFCRSLELGVITMNNEIIGKVGALHDMKVEEEHITAVIQGQETILPEDVKNTIREAASRHADTILDKLRELQVDLRSNPVIFIGGGAALFKEYIANSPMVAKADFILDPKANAIGYEMLASAQIQKINSVGEYSENE